MSTFDDRENAYENKFAHDAETKFKIEARRNKKLAVWAAGLMGADAEEYTMELIKADMEEAGAEDVVTKLIKDLDGKADEGTIRENVSKFEAEATKEVTEG